MAVKPEDLWGSLSPEQCADKVELLKGALATADKSYAAHQSTGASWIPPHAADDSGTGGWQEDPAVSTIAELEKAGTDPELIAQVQASLAIQKDVSLTSPLSTGLVPYDLAPLAMVVSPPLTPLRNKIPRTKGQGKARQYKRITGISGGGTGGVASLSPFINDGSTISSGSLTVRRPPKISYASDEKTINYKQFGVSDLVVWSAEFAGLGLTDARGLSSIALTYAHMLAEERAMLAGRGTDSGFVGALGTPATANVTLTVRNAGAGETGNSANIATLYVRIAAEGMFGDSIASAEITTTGMSAATGKVVDVTMTGAYVAGATGFKIFAGTATGLANQYYSGRTGCWGGVTGQGTAGYTINFTGGGTGGCPNSGANGLAAESASSADAFDGVLSAQLDPTQSGAIRNVGGKLATATPGSEFQDVFTAIWQGGSIPNVTGVNASATSNGVKGQPTDIWMSGMDRKQFSAAFLVGGSGNPSFFFNVPQGDANNVQAGQVVTAILNEVAGGGPVNVNVHPWLPQGNALVLSSDLPYPDSQVPNLFEMRLPQDMVRIDWPVIQTTYDVSTYAFGGLIQYAPMFSGAVVNILAA